MSFEFLTLEIDDRLAVVRLPRPATRNALSQALMQELTRCARELAERIDIDVAILTGAGPCFSAGADLHDARSWAETSLPLVARREIAALGHRMCKAWEEMPQITIAAIEAHAVGGGLALALACDWRVLADDAFVSLPEISLGIPLTWGTIPRLTNLLGSPPRSTKRRATGARPDRPGGGECRVARGARCRAQAEGLKSRLKLLGRVKPAGGLAC